ncbi:hypothetical protein SAMN05216559_0437 [Halomicrobium zhouii]|uniref:Uncharacterized protein n=1 Tax=Halomicrobium zhouii TaxID=767519 RepID=A0A1I6KA05_9EURY|nr:hypothetical protein [Halomicrobium zhouii]SFR88036.1 hypothetical protein SAMN05216559_0437 [Halomicrobium zhouii]
MATSVPVSDETKARLEQLQATIERETGQSVTQQELLDRIVEREFESRDALIASYRDDWDGLSDEERDQWLSGTQASGNPVDEGDIDAVLYEDEALNE